MRLTTFLHGGAITRGRMKVYYESLAAVRRYRFRDAKMRLNTFILGGAIPLWTHGGLLWKSIVAGDLCSGMPNAPGKISFMVCICLWEYDGIKIYRNPYSGSCKNKSSSNLYQINACLGMQIKWHNLQNIKIFSTGLVIEWVILCAYNTITRFPALAGIC